MPSTLVVALACPDCPPARAARALVASDAFWQHAGYAVLPFLIIAILIAAIVRRVDRPSRRV